MSVPRHLTRQRIERRFDQRDRTAPRSARALVGALGDLEEETRADLAIVLSELVANAIRHSPRREGGQVTLLVERRGGRVHIEVCDPGGGFDPTPDPRREGGLGLLTVSRVARAWGIKGGERTMVWCDFVLEPRESPAPRI